MSPPVRFIIFRPGALGDTLAAAPTLWALAQRYPEARIEYLSERHSRSGVVTAREALTLIPEVANSYLYDAGSGWLSRLRQVRAQISPNTNDILLYLCYEQPSLTRILRDWAFFYLAGFRHFAGFKAAISSRLTPRKDKKESEYQRIFRFANDSKLDLPLEAHGRLNRDEDWVKRFWHDKGLEGRRVVAVCPGSKMQSKRWAPERYAEIVTRVSQSSPGVSFVMLGTEGDRAAVERIRSLAKGHLIDALNLSLPRSCAVLSLADAYLGNDTGPMHMAALLGIPCVALFSSRDRAGKWAPWGTGHEILRTEINCAGCMLETCFADPPECLASISVDAVEKSLTTLLNDGRSGMRRGAS